MPQLTSSNENVNAYVSSTHPGQNSKAASACATASAAPRSLYEDVPFACEDEVTREVSAKAKDPKPSTDALITTSQSFARSSVCKTTTFSYVLHAPDVSATSTTSVLQPVQPVGQVSAPQPGTAAIVAALLWHVATPSSSLMQLSSAGSSIQRAQPSQLMGCRNWCSAMTQPFEGALVVGVDDGCGVVGAGVGVTEGAGVGLTEGAGVGRKLGLTDGWDDGRGEGAVGVFVGLGDGMDVGRAVG